MRGEKEQEKFIALVTELVEQRITFNQTIGLKVFSHETQGPVVRFAMQPELVGHYSYGRLHGGVIASALDAVGGFALMLALAERFPEESADQIVRRFAKMGTIDLRVDFLSQGIGAHFDAQAKVTRMGTRIASVQMSLVNDANQLIATGAAAYVVS
jgi:uncharacterized protein (TIGR00369 family)